MREAVQSSLAKVSRAKPAHHVEHFPRAAPITPAYLPRRMIVKEQGDKAISSGIAVE